MGTNLKVMVPLAVAALMLGAIAVSAGTAGAQSVPVGGGPSSPLVPPAPPAPPPVAPPQSPIEAPVMPVAPNLPTGGQAGAGTRPAALPSAGTGANSPGDASGLLVLAATGVMLTGAGVSMRRIGRRS